VTLSGGTVTMSNNTSNFIFGASSANTLTNAGTIQGAGHIGNGSMGLVNSGVINANQPSLLTIQANRHGRRGDQYRNAGSDSRGNVAVGEHDIANGGGTISANGTLWPMKWLERSTAER